MELDCIIADQTTGKEISGTKDNGIAIALIRKAVTRFELMTLPQWRHAISDKIKEYERHKKRTQMS
jgi:hypothetical protein